jgi:glutamate racemase
VKIGVFDSGYGGLTILQAIRKVLPQYDYIYLGDNARAPYGTHSFEVIYSYTLQAVRYLFDQGCTLVILACNTASAKALRTIQQCDLPAINNASRKVNVLGVIRPTVEAVPTITQTGHVGILATPATVSSESYVLELAKISEAIQVAQQACPLWVPIIEAGEHESQGADFFVDKYLQSLLSRDPKIDTLVLCCTHYPLLLPKIEQWLKEAKQVRVIAQGSLVADSLADYLKRHPEYRDQLSQNGTCIYLTTEDAGRFSESASLFLDAPVQAQQICLN